MTSLNLLQTGELDSAFITDLQVDTISSFTNPSISILSPLDFTIVPTIQSNTLESFIRQQITVSGSLTYNNLNGLITGLTIDTTNSIDIDLSILNDTLLSANLSQTFINRIDGLSGDIDTLLNETKFFTGNGLNNILMISTGNLIISGDILTSNLIVSSNIFGNDISISGNATFNNLFSNNINSISGTFTNLHSNNLDANNATFNNLFSNNIDCNNLESNKATFTQLNSNRLIIDGNATFGSNISTTSLFVANNCNILGNLTTTGLTRNNTLIVSGNTTFNSNVSILTLQTTNLSLNGNLVVSAVSISNNLNILGNFTTTGNTNLRNLVQVNNLCELVNTGNVGLSINSNPISGLVFLDFNSFDGVKNDYDSRIIAELGISGQTAKGALSLETGNLNLQGTDSISLNGGNITISGNTTFNSNLSTSALFVENEAILTVLKLNGTFLCQGNATFGSNLSTSGLFVSNNCNLNTCSITGQLTLASNVIVGTNIRLVSSTGQIQFFDASVIMSRENNSLLFNTDSNTRMIISQNGNVGIGVVNPTSKLNIKGRLRIENLNLGDSSSVIEMKNELGNVSFFFVDNTLSRFNFTNSLVINHNNVSTDGLNIQNSNITNNLTRGSHLRFSARDTVNSVKAIGGIVSLPANADYIDSITRITGRKGNVADFNSVEIRHANQEMIIGLNSNASSSASLYLVNDTNVSRGARFHYNGDSCFIDLNTPSGGPTPSIFFRIDNSSGSAIRGQVSIEGDYIANRRLVANNVPALGTTDAFTSGNGTFSVAFSDIRMKKDIEIDYDISEVWKTIKPIKYFYKTKIANQVAIKGGYRKQYGLDASNLDECIRQTTPNTPIQMCEYCQNQACNPKIDNCAEDCCRCDDYEKIDACNYSQREIISLCVSKINQLETNLVKERIAYKIEKDKTSKSLKELTMTITQLMGKLRLSGIKC